MPPSGMIDLHCHLLPGVDDGPETLDESLEYAALAVEAGTRAIVATPHVELVDVPELPERVRALQEALDAEGIPLDVECGGELKPRSVPGLDDGQLDLIAHGPPDGRWVLLEVPFSGFDEELVDAAAELRGRGFGIVLAHPERAERFGEGLPLLEAELGRGAVAQMNVGPLWGRESRERGRAARRELQAGIATAIATDAHPPGRPYTLRDGWDAAVDAGAGEAEATQLVREGPKALLATGLAIA